MRVAEIDVGEDFRLAVGLTLFSLMTRFVTLKDSLGTSVMSNKITLGKYTT